MQKLHFTDTLNITQPETLKQAIVSENVGETLIASKTKGSKYLHTQTVRISDLLKLELPKAFKDALLVELGSRFIRRPQKVARMKVYSLQKMLFATCTSSEYQSVLKKILSPTPQPSRKGQAK